MSLIKRIGVLGVGLTANALMVWPFDYLLYPFIINRYGWIEGGVIMMIASFVYCLLTFAFYDWAKQDWLGLETLKEAQDVSDHSFLGRIVKKANKQWLVFTVFSLQTDPFITTVYMRRGAHQYNRLSARDWKIFLGSLLLGNIFWILVCSLGLETAKALGLSIGQLLAAIFVIMVVVYSMGVFMKNKSRVQ